MTDLLSLEEFSLRQGIEFDPTNWKAARAVQDASAFVRKYTAQTITLVEDDEVRRDGKERPAILLPERPVVDVTSVTLLSLDNVETELESTSYRVDSADILWRLDGGVFCDGPASVIVVYDHGYDPVPDDILGAVYELAAENYISTGGGAVTSEQILSYQVTYDAASAGSAEMPDKVQYILDCYRDHR